jgi:hypothetical protein
MGGHRLRGFGYKMAKRIYEPKERERESLKNI